MTHIIISRHESTRFPNEKNDPSLKLLNHWHRQQIFYVKSIVNIKLHALTAVCKNFDIGYIRGCENLNLSFPISK